MKKIYELIIIITILLSCENNVSEELLTFEEKLSGISDIKYEKLSSPIANYNYYLLSINQAIDHTNPSIGSFSQKVRLFIKNPDSPSIILTNGYGLSSKKNIKKHELTEKLNANQIEVEHRYFGESKPEQIDWSTLTIKQAATDHHRIIELLKLLFRGKWISAGTSKGGMTASYHRRFFPNDIEGTVAYVAPLSLDIWDERYASYSMSVVDKRSIEKYKLYQRQALLKIDSLVLILDSWAKENGYEVSDSKYSTKDRLEAEIALSWITAASWYPNMNSEKLPLADDNAYTYLEYIYQSTYFRFLTTSGLVNYYPYHVHAALELGNFSAPLDHIKDLLTSDVKDFGLNFPTINLPTFNPNVMQDIYQWAQNDAKNIIFIYGKEDIFTAGAYPITTDIDKETQIHIEPGVHGIKISDLSATAQKQIFDALNRWIRK